DIKYITKINKVYNNLRNKLFNRVEDMDGDFSPTACLVYPASFDSNYDLIAPESLNRETLHCTALFLGDIDENLFGMSAGEIIDVLLPIKNRFLLSTNRYYSDLEWKLFGQ